MPASRAISDRDDASPAAPQSWSDSTSPRSTSSPERLDQLLAGERVADLDGRPLLGAALGQVLAGQHAGAADAVAAGRRAVEDDRVAGPSRARARETVDRQQPDAHRVDEAVVLVGRVEDGLAADGRDAARVAVVADALDGALEAVVGRPEAQPVEERDRARAHGEDVAEDAADARRRALERLDRGRMVVALHLEGHGLAVAQVDDAGVLPGPLEHARAGRRQAPEQRRGVLVRAVLGPEQREDGELEVVRLAPDQLADPVQLAVRQAERAMKRLSGDRRQGPDARRCPGGDGHFLTGTVPVKSAP